MKRSVLIVLGVLFLLFACFCGIQIWRSAYAPAIVESEALPSLAPTLSPVPTPGPESAPASSPEPTAVPTPSPTPYISPIDFDRLREINPDIYGWIEIEDTNIDYPVVQSAENGAFYLTHNSDGAYSANGSIFSESEYNSFDFSDPVTILYGHHMNTGAMFGRLQQYYTDDAFFSEHPIIRIYTPDALLEYGVFAAVPYSSSHILFYNDFEDNSVFTSFVESIMNTRELSARFREEYTPAAGDRILILSTCLAGNNTRRFLVLATLLG